MSVQISISNLAKAYGGHSVLHDLNLETGADWRCLGIVGRNGAGKTTLLRILMGLLEKSAGSLRIQFGGSTHSTFNPKQALFLAEHPCLPESFTGHQYGAFMADLNRLLGIETDFALRQRLSDSLRLDEHLAKPVLNMSKGTRRKLELVSALSSQIPVIVIDELSDGLDIPSMEEASTLIRSSSINGKRFIITSHDLSFLCGIADQIAVIDGGRCADHFPCSADFEHNKARILAAFKGRGPCS